ncbi:UbiA prenyltransferase family [Xylaria telfairii]|nr:UbiA prenyltransferase family [Xylaria telfairii]
MSLKTSRWFNILSPNRGFDDRIIDTSLYHLYSIWLFTFSDLKTILFPQTIFGILTALSQIQLGKVTSDDTDAYEVLYRIPIVMFWVWIHLLPVDIHNQQQPNGILEDKINKPWRPLPSNRCTLTQARYAMLFFYGLAAIISYQIGPLRWSASIMALGTGYNSLGGSDVNPFVRNFIVSLGYAAFGLGALEIAQHDSLNFGSQGSIKLPSIPSLEAWVILLTLVILTTIQVQDMEDQEGDVLRGRRSLPLQIGDGLTRCVTAVFMAIWGLLCPYFWGCGWFGYAIATPLAYLVALRSMVYRTVEHDKTTHRIWNMWIAGLYLIPLLSAEYHSGLGFTLETN